VLEQDGARVVGYHEKPTLRYTASAGVYVYEPSVLATLSNGPLQFPELVLRLLAEGQHVVAYPTTAAWSHIGTIEQHEEASRTLFALPEELTRLPENPARITEESSPLPEEPTRGNDLASI